MTKDNERYKCIIPQVGDETSKKENMNSYRGPSEEILLTPLFEQTSCSYKIEPYWTYELCHRKFLRQYHEEKDVGKDLKIQEYYLGNFRNKEATQEQESTDQTAEEDETSDERHKIIQIGSQPYPYYEVNFTDGTPCDLTGHPRTTSVKYICHELGRGEIYDLKEISTCQYEVIILTQLLCSHPIYQPQKDPINKIKCHSLDGAPQQPVSLVNFELENSQGHYSKREDHAHGQTKPRVARTPSSSSSSSKPATKPNIVRSDKQLLKDFLSGEYCIQGGTGWWKHEFCYGKSVTQFHEERTGKSVITLGLWDEDKHLRWLSSHPGKRPSQLAKDRKVVHQYYSGGDVCDLTNKPRNVEVKLRCKDNPSHPNSIALYLVEAKTCEYSLVVESQILCPILQQSDDFGIIDDPEL